MALSLFSSIILVLLGKWIPELFLSVWEMVKALNFYDLLINMTLTLAIIGTVISTFLVGAMTYLLFMAFNQSVDMIYCLLFGALISPADPIAVLGILKKANIPQSLEIKIPGSHFLMTTSCNHSPDPIGYSKCGS